MNLHATWAEKVNVQTGIWGMISFLCDVLLGLTQEIYTYSSVVTAEIDFKNMYMASFFYFLFKEKQY